MSRNSSMFSRLDSFAKKMKTSERTPRSSDKKHHKHHKGHDDNKEATDGARHIDTEDLDMNLLIGPNKGKTAAQIIDELDSRYFQEAYDPLTEILASLPAQQSQRSDDLLEAKLNELDVVKLCIDKRLSNQVFANYHHFVDGLSLIGDIKDDLFETSLLCTDGRARLAAVSKELTLSIFSTLQHSQRTARLLTIQAHLQEINTLLRREKEITLLLKEGEFLSAVSVYQQSFTRLSQTDMNEFTCLDDLRKRYGRSADAINLRAKEQLTLMCKKFDLALCKNVVESMITLRETKSLADILRKSFPSLIDDLSITSLLPYVNHDLIANQDDGVDIRSKKMKDVAALLDMTQFAACYLTITTNFADTLSSCHRMSEYFESLCNTEDNNNNHNNNSNAAAPTHTSTIVDSNASIRRDLIAVRDFLSVYRQEIWAAVQQHMVTLLSSVYLTTQTIYIDDFLRILHAGYAFVTVGESFARLNSDGFRGMLHRKAAEYIKVFARDSFDHVRNALERDEWKVLKVSPSLTMTDVPEFKPRSYKQANNKRNGSNHKSGSTNTTANGLMDDDEHKELSSPTTEANGMDESPTSQSQQIMTRSRDLSLQSLDPDDLTAGALYESFLRGDNPFRVMLQEQLAAYDQRYQEKQQERDKGKYYKILNQHNNAAQTSVLLAPAHVQSSIHKATLLQPVSSTAITSTNSTASSSPRVLSPFVLTDSAVILTASSYQTVQYIGRYINIMEDIKPLAADSFLHLQDLFDFYVYSVFCLFGLAQQNFFTEYFDKYLTLKKCVVGVKQRVEQGSFAAGIFASFALKHSNPNEMMSPSSALSPGAGAGNASAPNTPAGTPSGQGGAAAFYASSAANPTKEKSLLGKLNKGLNTAISSAASAADKVTSTVANTAKHTSAAFSQQQHQQQQAAAREREDSKRSHPILVSVNESIELDDEKHMYGVMERCIATESLAFIIAAFVQNHDRMVTLLKPSEVARLSAFLTYAQQVYRELQIYMYRNLAPIMLPKEVFAPKISHVSWVLTEPAQRASPYVSSILTVLRAHDISIKANGGLPLTIATKLYDETLVWLTEQMIEAYATVKKCNTEGRGLMILDVTLLQAGLNKMLPLTASTAQQRWQHVTEYINAYYLTAEEWVEWVRTHQDYTLSVIVSCIQCGCGSGMEKKEQKELLLNVSREWQRIQEEKEMEAEQRKEEAKQKEKEDNRL